MTSAAGPTDGGAPSATVVVLTYRRPDDLAAVLPLLVRQAGSVSPAAEVLVVDNDPDGSGRAIADEHPVRYVGEPTPGIAAARNRALVDVTTDLLVFIDDDERPTDSWLADLLAMYVRDRPAAVVGPVVSTFESELDPWVAAGRFFERRRWPTGTQVQLAATNNLLLDLAQVRGHGLSFHTGLGLSGGSDTLFSRQLARAGGRMLWCDTAVVVDVVPAARQTRSWVLRRAFRAGNTWSRTSLLMAASTPRRVVARLEFTARGLVRVGAGALRAGAGVLARSTSQQARGVRTVARGLGLVAGAWGMVYTEYRRSTSAV